MFGIGMALVQLRASYRVRVGDGFFLEGREGIFLGSGGFFLGRGVGKGFWRGRTGKGSIFVKEFL